MNDDLIRTFCESRYRWPIVAIVTTLLTLVTVYPFADDYFDERSKHAELTVQLEEAEATAVALPAEEATVAELTARLARLESRTVDESTVPAFRSRLVELVRASGCQIRRLDVGAPNVRPWNQGDHAIEKSIETGPPKPTPFALERRAVLLAVDGPMTAIHGLLEQIEKERQLAHPHRLQLASASRGGTTVTMELELWYFALAGRKG